MERFPRSYGTYMEQRSVPAHVPTTSSVVRLCARVNLFEFISHKSIWDALKSCNIEHHYIRLLKKLYRDQKATVLTDEESDIFELVLQQGSAESTGRRHSAWDFT